MATLAKANPARHRLANGQHGGWSPSRPAPQQDWSLKRSVNHGTPSGIVSLKSPENFPRIRAQGKQGSCGGQSARSCLYYVFKRKHGDKISGKWGEKWDLSPAGIYFRSREEGGYIHEDDGVENRQLWDAMRKHGAPTEESCPYNASHLVTKLSPMAVKTGRWHQSTVNTYRCDLKTNGDGVVDNMLHALASDMPIHFGFTCFANLDEADDSGVVPMPKGKDDGGHDVAIFWADVPNRIFWGPNSWGKKWGGNALSGAKHQERGYIGIPFQYVIDGNASDLWAVDIE